jgi:5'-3' exonuclease
LTEKFGVTPRQMADFLALTGDAVDNIPGVPGIGPKSAAALLRHFGDFDNLFARLDEVPALGIRGAASMHRKLLEHRDAAELARRLTVIETAVESALAAPGLLRGEVDTARLNRLFDELAFGGMLRQRCLRV